MMKKSQSDEPDYSPARRMKSFSAWIKREEDGRLIVERIKLEWEPDSGVDRCARDVRNHEWPARANPNVTRIVGLVAAYDAQARNRRPGAPPVILPLSMKHGRALSVMLGHAQYGELKWLSKIFGSDKDKSGLIGFFDTRPPTSQRGEFEVTFLGQIQEVVIYCNELELEGPEDMQALADEIFESTSHADSSNIGMVDVRIWSEFDEARQGISLLGFGGAIATPLRCGEYLRVDIWLYRKGYLHLYGIDATGSVKLLSDPPKDPADELNLPVDPAQYMRLEGSPGLEALVLAVQNRRLEPREAEDGQFVEALRSVGRPPEVDPHKKGLVHFRAIDRVRASHARQQRAPNSAKTIQAKADPVRLYVRDLCFAAGWRADAMLVLTYPLIGTTP